MNAKCDYRSFVLSYFVQSKKIILFCSSNKRLGFRGPIHELNSDYLKDRWQFMSMNGVEIVKNR